MSPSFFSGNIANMIPEGPLNKMVPLTEDHGGGGRGAGEPTIALHHGHIILIIPADAWVKCHGYRVGP